MFLPGYAVYLAMVLVPGFGFGEALHAWKESDSLAVRLGYIVGLGLAIDTVIFVVKTWGLQIGGIVLRGYNQDTIYFIVAAGVVALGLSLCRQKRLTKLPPISSYDIGVLVLVAAMGAMIALYFQCYPIFPGNFSPDFTRHVQDATMMVNGSKTTFPHELLYGGAIYQLGAGFLLVGGVRLVVVQRIMAIMALLSVFVVYTAALRLLGSRRAALLSTVIYSLSGTVWVDMVLLSGLYSNLFGVIIALFLAVELLDLSGAIKSRQAWVLGGIVFICTYFSHYTVLSILPALLLAGVLLYLRYGKEYKGYLVASATAIAPALLGALLLPREVARALGESYGGGGTILLGTWLSRLLSGIPSVAYMAVVIFDDPALVVMLALLAVALYKGWIARQKLLLVPVIWFFALLLAAPADTSAWRFSLEAVVPLTLLAGYGLHSLLPKGRATKKTRLAKGDPYRFFAVGLIVLFLAPILFNSWGMNMIATTTTNPTVEAGIQNDDYAAIVWLGQNTPPGSRYLSVSDPTFLYVNLLLNRNCTYRYVGSPEATVAYAKNNSFGYVIVTYYAVIPVKLPAGETLWGVFQSSSNLTLIHQEATVEIFQVN